MKNNDLAAIRETPIQKDTINGTAVWDHHAYTVGIDEAAKIDLFDPNLLATIEAYRRQQLAEWYRIYHTSQLPTFISGS